VRSPWLLWIMTVVYAVDLQETTGMNNSTETPSDVTLLLGLDGLEVERVEVDGDGRRVVRSPPIRRRAAAGGAGWWRPGSRSG
jgi:hypothetical protein